MDNSYEEKVNAAGIINSALGTGIANGVQAVFTKPENKPATRKDIQDLISQVKERYIPVMNMPQHADGTKPYYDTVQKAILYLPVR